MRDIGVFAITFAVLLVFTINSAYAQSPDIYTSNQTTLSDNLNNNPVEIEGIFVPAIKDNGNCIHIVYKSGYILTDFEGIRPLK